jgi:hypothetical protein
LVLSSVERNLITALSGAVKTGHVALCRVWWSAVAMEKWASMIALGIVTLPNK